MTILNGLFNVLIIKDITVVYKGLVLIIIILKGLILHKL